MKGSEEERPRKIVKKTGHGGHHGGAWKVAYADFVTAMMALFIVLWIVGQSTAVKEAVAGYFKDPVGFTKSGGKGVLKGGTGPGGAVVPPQSSPPATGPGSTPPAEKSDRAALEATAAALKAQILGAGQFEKFKDKIQIEVVDEGLRVQLLDTGQGDFFDVGSASVRPATRQLIALIAHEVAKLPNDIKVEGHTDSRPYAGKPDYSNWELSADRANTARRILEISGVRPEQVASVVGYADRHLANAADPFDAANRRISIIVRPRQGAAGGKAAHPGAVPPPKLGP